MLRIRLFGQVEVEVDGTRLMPPAGRRAWALLSWLALHPGLNSRSRVASAFWPDMPDAAARQNLRSAVRVLRQGLTEAGARHLKGGRDQLGLDPPEEIRLDLDEFADLVAAGRLADAVAVARAELLAGFDDEWVQEPRERVRAEVLGVLEQLALRAEAAADPDAALAWTRRQAELAPQAEEPQRRLMTRLAAAGDVPAALVTYARFRDRLRRELRLTPSTQLRRLAEELSWRPTPDDPAAGDLIARDDELRQLLAGWRDARDGAGVVLGVRGEPGVGKTRLTMELARRARADAGRVAVGTALELGAGTPLSLWAELVGNLLGELGSGLPAPPADATWPAALEVLVPDLESRLGRSRRPRIAWSPELERVRLFEAVVAMLEWLAGHGPLLLIAEDLHAADAVSLELLGHVARRIGRLPLLLVFTRRPLPRRGELDGLELALRARGVLAGELTLGALDDDATIRIARSVAPGLPATQLDRVRSAAQGNPLIAVEWARALARGERRPPESLRGVVRAALAPLSEDARRLADLAAVAGRPLRLAEIESLDIGSPADAGVDVLDTGLLRADGGGLGFRHALLREAAYQDLPAPRRAALHASVAMLLGRDSGTRHAAEAAYHFLRAGRSGDAIRQLTRASAHARSVAALDEAADLLAEATRLAETEPATDRLPALRLELAEVQAWRGRSDDSETLFTAAIADLTDAAALAGAWVRRANWNLGALCHPPRVRESARAALELLDDLPGARPELRLEALTTLAWAEAVAGDVRLAEDLIDRGRRLLDGSPASTPMAAQRLAHAEALSLIRRGRFTDAYHPLILAGRLAHRAGRPDLALTCWFNLACAASCADDPAHALGFVDRGLAVARASGLASREIPLLTARAHVLLRLGRAPEAVAACEDGRRVAERLDDAGLRAANEHDRGLVALALGDPATAARLLAQALRHRAPVSRPLARLARAEALTRLGDYGEAEQELREAVLEPVRASDLPGALVPRLTRLQGLIAAGRGDRSLAIRRLGEAADGWRRLSAELGEGDAYAAVLADLGRPPVAGLIEPARELAVTLAELAAVRAGERTPEGRSEE